MSKDATLFTGASKNSKASFDMVEAISPPIPPVRLASCNIKTLFVFFTDSITVFLSQGKIVLKSIISTEAFIFLTMFLAHQTPLP